MFKFDNNYTYTEIQNTAVRCGADFDNYGNGCVGSDFIVVATSDTVYSFVLNPRWLYTCVYISTKNII